MKNLIKTITLSILAMSLAYGADEKPKQPSFADEAYNKAVSENTKDCEKLYSDYINSLDVANKKIVKSLEATIKELNDVKKGKLSLTERADAIKAIEEKIASVKESGVGGAVEGRVVAKGTGQVDLGKAIVGKWKLGNTNITWEIKSDGKCVSSYNETKGVWKNKFINEYVIQWSNGETVQIFVDKMRAVTTSGTYELIKI